MTYMRILLSIIVISVISITSPLYAQWSLISTNHTKTLDDRSVEGSFIMEIDDRFYGSGRFGASLLLETQNKDYYISSTSFGANTHTAGATEGSEIFFEDFLSNSSSNKQRYTVNYTLTPNKLVPSEKEIFVTLVVADVGSASTHYFSYNNLFNKNSSPEKSGRRSTLEYHPEERQHLKEDDLAVVSPNPVSDFLTINQHPSAPIVSVNLINKFGQLVYSSDNAQQRIDVRHLPSAVYILNAHNVNGQIISKKVIIHH